MLVLSRKNREAVVIGGSGSLEQQIKVTVLEINGSRVKLGFELDNGIPVCRWEIWDRMKPGQMALLPAEPAAPAVV